MDHRQNDQSYGRDERHRGESDRNQRPQQSGRDFYPGTFGFEEQGRERAERPGERQGFFERMFKRGPKGYQRSDERLREDISERLMYAMHIDSSEVTVTVAGGKVTLEGTVPERDMKHAIEDLADECPGVQDIDNRVRVQRQLEDRPATGEGTSGSRKGGS